MRRKRPGRWLYRRNNLAWLSDPSLRRQLPSPYRAFAFFCSFQTRTLRRRRALGGWAALRAAQRAADRRGLPDFAQLVLSERGPSVWLDLRDPRFLHVPTELIEITSDAHRFVALLAPGDTLIDVGANHGSFSILAGEAVGERGRVVAVEPQPRLAFALAKSLEANGTAPYDVHEIVCGTTDGEIDLFIPAHSSGSTGVFAGYSATGDFRRIRAECRPFDKLVDWRTLPGRVHLKLDIEGGELGFLNGARAMILGRQPVILMEWNPASASAAGVSADELISCLKELGYAGYRELDKQETSQLEDLAGSRHRNVVIVPDPAP